jgi:predicted RNase H-like nuclease
LVELVRLAGTADVLGWIDRVGPGPEMAAVDAPLVVPNATGMRVPDRAAHVNFGKYHAGCYPANQGSAFIANTSAFEAGLVERGFHHAAAIEPRQPGRYMVEVYPNAAMVQLFDLDRIVRYKKGRVADRVRELRRFRGLLLEMLPRLTPPVVGLELPEVPPGGVALKDLEDRLDALLCAYVGAYWWYWGLERNLVLGSEEDGYIVVPQRLERVDQSLMRLPVEVARSFVG